MRKQNLANHLLNYTNNNSNLTQHGVIKSNRFIDQQQRSLKNLVYQNFNQNSFDENLEYNNLYNPYADENERMENFQLSKSNFCDDSNDSQMTYTNSRDGQFGFDRTNTIGQTFKNSQVNKPSLNHTVVNNEFKKIERVNTFSRLQYARNIQFNNFNSSSNINNSNSQQFYQNYTNLNNNIENIVPSHHQSTNVDETFKNYDLNDDFWLNFDS